MASIGETLVKTASTAGNCRIPEFFNHVTITTGHSRQSYLTELSPEFSLRVHLEETLAGTAQIPNFPAFSARAEVVKDGELLVSVHQADNLQVKFLIVDRNDAVSRNAFEHLQAADFLGAVSFEPDAPYCAVSISVTTLVDPTALLWIADYQRCLSWEWFKKLSEVAAHA